MEADDWFPLQELTLRLGALVWVESQLSEVVSLWSRVESDATAAVLFAATAGHHGWHADIIRDCLPTSPSLFADEAVTAPTAGWQSTVTTMASLIDPDATATRLKILVRVVDPWLQREIDVLTDLARPVSDAASSRWLRFVSLDHHDDGKAASELLGARSNRAVGFDEHLLVSELDLS